MWLDSAGEHETPASSASAGVKLNVTVDTDDNDDNAADAADDDEDDDDDDEGCSSCSMADECFVSSCSYCDCNTDTKLPVQLSFIVISRCFLRVSQWPLGRGVSNCPPPQKNELFFSQLGHTTVWDFDPRPADFCDADFCLSGFCPSSHLTYLLTYLLTMNDSHSTVHYSSIISFDVIMRSLTVPSKMVSIHLPYP